MVKLATLPLQRRLIGAGVMLVGVFIVAIGFFASLTNGAQHGSITVPVPNRSALTIPLGSHNAMGILQHVADHPLLGDSSVRGIADAAVRVAVILMAAGAALGLVSIFLPPLRGFAGLGAGLGLLGDAVVAGVLFGENTRVHADFSHNPQIYVDLGAALWVLAVGFGLILVGGALAAWRPLAGLFSGLSLALTGAGLGAGLAILVGGNHLVTALLSH